MLWQKLSTPSAHWKTQFATSVAVQQSKVVIKTSATKTLPSVRHDAQPQAAELLLHLSSTTGTRHYTATLN